MYRLLPVLEEIAAGTLSYRVTSPKGTTVYEPTARDRVAAIDKLAAIGGLSARDANELVAVGQMTANAVLSALSDPSVRRWLVEERPETLALLAPLAAQRAPAQADEADYEVLPSGEGLHRTGDAVAETPEPAQDQGSQPKGAAAGDSGGDTKPRARRRKPASPPPG